MKFTEIMIVEDNQHDVAMIMEALEEKGHGDKVTVLSNGAEALDYIFGPQGCLGHPHSACPRFILLDLKLPKVEGLEVLQRLKNDPRIRDVPVVIFTSSNETRDRQESYRRGANSYLVKPMDADQFSQCVNRLATYWLTMNRTPYHDR